MMEAGDDEALVILCTAPDAAVADTLAAGVVAARLAACVNIVPQIVSVYRWEGEVKRDAEVLLVIKSTRARFEELAAFLRAQHPYDVPEIIALPIAAGDAA